MLDNLKISIAQKLYPVHIAESREEYEAIWAFRYSVQVNELKRHDFPGADHDQHWIRSDSDESDTTYLLYTGSIDKIKGSIKLRLFPPGEIPSNIYEEFSLELFEDIDTRKIAEISSFLFDRSLRGTGAAAALVCRAVEIGAKLQWKVVFVSCVPGHLKMYQKFGLRPYGAPLMNQYSSGMVVGLVGVMDIDYVRRIGSPMYYILKKVQRCGELDNSNIDPLLRVIEEGSGNIESDASAIKKELDNFLNEYTTPGRQDAPLPPVSLLTSLPERLIHKLSMSSHIINIAPGDSVIQQDVRDQELHFILDGLLEVHREGKVLLTRGKGDMIGEIGFIRKSGIRSASVFAVAPSRLLVLRRSFLKRLVKNHPKDACIFYEAFSSVMAEHIDSL